MFSAKRAQKHCVLRLCRTAAESELGRTAVCGLGGTKSVQNPCHFADQAGNKQAFSVACAASMFRSPNVLRRRIPKYCLDLQRSSMPNTSSAKKYLRQSTARRLRNRQHRSALRSRLKGFRTLLKSEPTREDADKQFSLVSKALDQAASKNLIHSNAAARTKSRLAALKKKVCS